MDPVTLQVTVADALGRPMRQIEPASLVDLMALAEVEGLPGSTNRDLDVFVDRVGKEMGDIPSGASWTEFVGDFSPLTAASIPANFRAFFEAQIGERGEDAAKDAAPILTVWADAAPDPFVVGEVEAKVERATKTATPRGATDKKGGGKATKKRATRVKEVDPVRERFIRDLCMERLRGYLENGLKETILVTGVSFSARKSYPNVTGPEVLGALKRLESEGLARRTAGRWLMERIW